MEFLELNRDVVLSAAAGVRDMDELLTRLWEWGIETEESEVRALVPRINLKFIQTRAEIKVVQLFQGEHTPKGLRNAKRELAEATADVADYSLYPSPAFSLPEDIEDDGINEEVVQQAEDIAEPAQETVKPAKKTPAPPSESSSASSGKSQSSSGSGDTALNAGAGTGTKAKKRKAGSSSSAKSASSSSGTPGTSSSGSTTGSTSSSGSSAPPKDLEKVPAKDIACAEVAPYILGYTGEEYFGRKVVLVKRVPDLFGCPCVKKEREERATLHNGILNQTDMKNGEKPSPYWAVLDAMSELGSGFTGEDVVNKAVEIVGEEKSRNACKTAFYVLKTHTGHPRKKECGYSFMVDPEGESKSGPYCIRGRKPEETMEQQDALKEAKKKGSTSDDEKPLKSVEV